MAAGFAGLTDSEVEQVTLSDGQTSRVDLKLGEGLTLEGYSFEGGPYLGFPRSHDVYGDGAIVVVPAPGHTPGSVIVFLALPDGQRLAMLGDLVWQREGITEREERPWVWRFFGDSDEAQVREHILHMASLAARFPELKLIPAHEARAFDALPALGSNSPK